MSAVVSGFGRAVHATVGPVLLQVYRTRFFGSENVPADTGAILAGNHVSYLDPALLWCGAPRHVHFMAKSSLFDGAFMGWALPRLWAFPVRRGEADRAAIATATDLARAGDLVGIFPEGTRVRPESAEAELGEAQGGVAFIAMRAEVPVVPVGIAGTELAMPPGARFPRFPHVTVQFGEPVHPADFTSGGRRERVAAMTEEIMRRISASLAQAKGRSDAR